MFRLRTVVIIAIGYGVGYVSGTRAGRPVYDRLIASVGTVANRARLTRGAHGPTATDETNDELTRLRSPAYVPVPGTPDQGREHGPTTTPTPRG